MRIAMEASTAPHRLFAEQILAAADPSDDFSRMTLDWTGNWSEALSGTGMLSGTD